MVLREGRTHHIYLKISRRFPQAVEKCSEALHETGTQGLPNHQPGNPSREFEPQPKKGEEGRKKHIPREKLIGHIERSGEALLDEVSSSIQRGSHSGKAQKRQGTRVLLLSARTTWTTISKAEQGMVHCKEERGEEIATNGEG